MRRLLRARKILHAAWAATVTLALATAAAAQSAAPKAPPGDATVGRGLFAARCAACHGADGAGGPMAPRLQNVYGGKAASQPGQKYSDALRRSQLRWTDENLDLFLKRPQALVSGTGMMATVSNAQQRRDLIAYLETLRGSGVRRD